MLIFEPSRTHGSCAPRQGIITLSKAHSPAGLAFHSVYCPIIIRRPRVHERGRIAPEAPPLWFRRLLIVVSAGGRGGRYRSLVSRLACSHHVSGEGMAQRSSWKGITLLQSASVSIVGCRAEREILKVPSHWHKLSFTTAKPRPKLHESGRTTVNMDNVSNILEVFSMPSST